MTDSRRLKSKKARAALTKSGGIEWTTIRRGLSLGYRSTSSTWFARGFVRGKLEYKRIGEENDYREFDQAKDAAEAWFKLARGETPLGYDVLAAIEDYARSKAANVAEAEQARVWANLRYLNKHITGELLARPVAELKTAELEHWRDALRVKPATRRRVFTILAAALTNAHRLHGAGSKDTWQRVKAVKIPKTERARLFIPTETEVAALLAKAEPDFALLVRGALYTGMRYGELAALEVRDFDPTRGTVSLRISKTGERDVLLSTAAVQFFKEQVKGKLSKARIFTTTEGEPWQPSMQHRRMRAATKVRAFVFYSLRHCALSRQLSAGIPSALVAKNAGTSEAMLRAHYHKIVPADRSLFDRVHAMV
ncbi:MAG: site-specific integrase [Burkholderiales bacterium]|nr:site-specific integrase [Burkholderiales bacterium]